MRPRRRHDDPVAPARRREDELEELLEHGSRNFRRYRRRAYLAFAILALMSTAGLYWAWDTAKRAGDLAAKIQTQRVDSIQAACVAQNERHDETLKALDKLIARLPPERRERARAGRNGTVYLIEALAPKRDCARAVRESAPPTS